MGSWKIIPICFPLRALRSLGESVVSSCPLSLMLPDTTRPLLGMKVHNGQRGDALATAGLAHHAQRFVLLDIKRDAPQDLIFFFADSEGCDQIFYFKHFFSHGIMASL